MPDTAVPLFSLFSVCRYRANRAPLPVGNGRAALSPTLRHHAPRALHIGASGSGEIPSADDGAAHPRSTPAQGTKLKPSAGRPLALDRAVSHDKTGKIREGNGKIRSPTCGTRTRQIVGLSGVPVTVVQSVMVGLEIAIAFRLTVTV